MIVKSLCAECNRRGGSKYGTHYADFIAKVASIVEKAKIGDHMIVSGVKRPLSFLNKACNPLYRQMALILRTQTRGSVNLFAVRQIRTGRTTCSRPVQNGGRRTGAMSFYNFARRRIETVAEFNFGPLEWSSLADRNFTAIGWRRFISGQILIKRGAENSMSIWLLIRLPPLMRSVSQLATRHRTSSQ